MDKISYQKHWVPSTDNQLVKLMDVVNRVEVALKTVKKEPANDLLEELSNEIDSQIIITANWIGRNVVPNTFYYSSLLLNAKKLGVLKKEIEFYIPKSSNAEFSEVADFYGTIYLLAKQNIAEDFNSYNEKQHKEFVQSFSGDFNPRIKFFENEFDAVDEVEVYEYFKTELVNTSYLEDNELKKYLVLAFQKNKTPSSKFTFKNKPNKYAIRKVFRDYQNNLSLNKYKKQRYAMLISDYFTGYKLENTITNWAK